MLQNLHPLHGRVLDAAGERIGRVIDFYFDDASWVLRYAILDTAPWLPGRQVLLGEFAFKSRAFGRSTVAPDFLRATVTRREIEESPRLSSTETVSRQIESDCHRYFGWPAYWNDEHREETSGALPFLDGPRPFDESPAVENHLRRVSSLDNCRVQGTDGMLGSVCGFAIDSQTWELCHVLVETGHWYSGKVVVVSPQAITRFSARDSTLWVGLTRGDVRRTLGAHHALDGPDDRQAPIVFAVAAVETPPRNRSEWDSRFDRSS